MLCFWACVCCVFGHVCVVCLVMCVCECVCFFWEVCVCCVGSVCVWFVCVEQTFDIAIYFTLECRYNNVFLLNLLYSVCV